MILVMMQTLWICAAVVLLTSSPVLASSLSQKQFHKRLTMAQVTAIALDHLLNAQYADQACRSLYGATATANRPNKDTQRAALKENMETFTTTIINEYYMAHHESQPDSERFFSVYREKAKAFETINREKLKTQHHTFYPYLKTSKYFSKDACKTGEPWPDTLADIREEMDSLSVLKPLGQDFKTTYRSLLQ